MRRYSEYAVGGLLSVVVIQALGYGLIFDINFFLRNLSVMGGLLMVLGDSFVKKSRVFAGLPSIDEKDKKMYIQLGGRVLLIFLFIGFVFAGEWSFWRVMVSLIGFVACVMVVVGFKAKLSAIILVVLLSVFNLIVNNFWTVSFKFNLKKSYILTPWFSSIRITHTRTLQNTISSKSYQSWVDFYYWSIWVQDNSAWMRRKKSIKSMKKHQICINVAMMKMIWMKDRKNEYGHEFQSYKTVKPHCSMNCQFANHHVSNMCTV